jgi:hypothetical protein
LSQIFFQNQKVGTSYISEHYAWLRQNLSLSWNYTAFGWLKLSNSASYLDAFMDRDTEGKLFVHGYSYSNNSTASMTIYGLQNFPTLPVTAVRHIVTPSVSYRYSPDFSELNKRFYTRSGISRSPKQRMLSMSLEQKWQFKLRAGENEQEKRLNDLFVLRSSTGYNLEAEEKPWSDINHTLSVNPGSYEVKKVNFSVNQSYSTTQSTYEDFEFTSWRINTNASISGNALYTDYYPLEKNNFITGNFFTPDTVSITNQIVRTIEDLEKLQNPGNWSVTTGHDYSYEKRYDRKTSNWRNSVNMKLTTNWSVSYSNYYDLEKNMLMSQSLTLNRDLHCWRITFTYSKSADFWDYRLMLFNIKLPDSMKVYYKDTAR